MNVIFKINLKKVAKHISYLKFDTLYLRSKASDPPSKSTYLYNLISYYLSLLLFTSF